MPTLGAFAMLAVVAIFAIAGLSHLTPPPAPATFAERFVYPAALPACDIPLPVRPRPPRKRTDMEIKGLAQSVARARAGIAQLRGASTDLEVSSSALTASLQAVTKQIDAMHADLKFEAETLGNSTSAASSVSAQPHETAHLPEVA